ncbi:terminase TerL endonuclease subunit [Bacillus sp. B-jedd]|uniref:terminase TerL endonuclease subunit n=1 Tax=Bacillus sp. B-jedd TaxID=1476857 RepID=UPI0005156023|nr:terminase TerL endonuclease subunit [Bacillus sp. B-jedd]CEG28088.1 terminase large subunit [Bacillus sp. B-jedd]
MISNKYVDEYIHRWKTGKILLNKERILLIEYLERDVLSRDDIYFDEEQIENYIAYSEKWYFPLDPWEKFIAPFIFLKFKDDDELFYEEFFITMGRGGGKNGFISTLSDYFTSQFHGIDNYDVSVVANSEDQAETSFKEVYNVKEKHPKLKKYSVVTKIKITNKITQSVFRFRTSNASTKDGGREGCVIYDEIHEMEGREVIDVFSGGLGKVPHPREFFIGTNGFVREGFYDKLMERSLAVLNGESEHDRIFPFICKLDDASEVDDEAMWEKANPAFEKPMTLRAKRLMNKVRKQFIALENNPGGRTAFMTKRMNYPETDLTKTVASWEDIWRTGFETGPLVPKHQQVLRSIPDLKHRTCIGGLDYASIKDFAAVGLLFKVGEDYVWMTHSFVRKGFLEKVTLKVPIKEWERDGLLTIVDGPVIDIRYIVDWFVSMRESYGITKIVADTFRLDLVKTALEAEGFEIEYIRNPRAIHSLLAPRVETIFAKRKIIFGDNPLMRWYTNNVYVHIKKDGNKEYLKKDEFRRKTDGFQAFIHALWKADELLDEEVDFFLADIKF